MSKSVLIVDDSRVALMALKRLLARYPLAVDTVESAEEAIGYLRTNVPGLIFLDHMMPGTDGFEALAAWKSDPRTAAIPVVMYTSKEGEAYMDQARRLGAIDVLSKPTQPLHLQQVLERLELIGPQVEYAQAVQAQVARVERAVAGGVSSRPQIRPVIERTPGRRISDYERATDPVAVTEAPVAPPAAPETPPAMVESMSRERPAMLAARALLYALLLLPGVWFYFEYRTAEIGRGQALEEILALKMQIANIPVVLPKPPKPVEAAPPKRLPDPALEALTWSANLAGRYGHDETPLSDARLEWVRGLVARLEAAGMRAVVTLEVHVGEFCLIKDGASYRLPADDLPFGDCVVMRLAPEEAAMLGRRQSAAFERFLAERTAAHDAVRVEVLSRGIDRPLAPYPDPVNVQTAGEWNRVARDNQRVTFIITPAR